MTGRHYGREIGYRPPTHSMGLSVAEPEHCTHIPSALSQPWLLYVTEIRYPSKRTWNRIPNAKRFDAICITRLFSSVQKSSASRKRSRAVIPGVCLWPSEL